MIKASRKGFQHRIDPKQQNPRDTAPLSALGKSSPNNSEETGLKRCTKISVAGMEFWSKRFPSTDVYSSMLALANKKHSIHEVVYNFVF